MDEIEEVLRRASQADRIRLLEVLEQLEQGHLTSLNVKRLSGSPFFRVRVGDFRIIFSQDKKTKEIIVESVKRRDEKTYR